MLIAGPSLAILRVIIGAKFVFKEVVCIKKHYRHSGFSTCFKEVQLHSQISGAIVLAKFVIFLLHQTWPRQ